MNELKKLRESVFKKVEQDNVKKQSALKKLDIIFGFSNSVNTTISFSELSLFSIGERVEINEEVSFEKTYQDENKLVFLTYMLDGGTFGVHSHDCFEFCKILKGNLFEKTRGLRVYNVNDIVCYAPNEVHTPYATEDSLYEVTFIKKVL